MLSLRNYQAQGPDSQFFPLMEEEEISQNKPRFPLSLWERTFAGRRCAYPAYNLPERR
jgi:hypothetical protein